MERPKVVTILWEDITGHEGGWMEIDDAKAKMPVRIVTAGLFLSEDEKYLVLASDWSWDGSVHTVNVIPKSVILERRDSKLPAAMWPSPRSGAGKEPSRRSLLT